MLAQLRSADGSNPYWPKVVLILLLFTRYASTSAALSRGLSVDLIKSSAGWSGDSLTFAKFYSRPTTKITILQQFCNCNFCVN